MRVFVTGGTGFVGAAVVADLMATGHEVLALARSEDSAARLTLAGAEPLRGDLADVAALRAGAAACDAVIHTAYDNSTALRMVRTARVERAALHAMGRALAGSGRPLVAAGGLQPVVRSGPLLTERDAASARRGLMGRNVERTVLTLVDAGVNASVVRLPVVHGEGDHFTLPRYIDIARRHGRSAMVGGGENRLPAVHHVDAARVFRLALERGVPGARYHAVAEEGVEFRAIAEVIGRRLGVPVVRLGRLAALREFGAYAQYAGSDRPASSHFTREQLGWVPTGPSLLANLDRTGYFSS